MIKSNYIVLDCETGGLDETKNPITQFAAVILDGSTLKETDRWETFIQPYGGLEVEPEVLSKTMVTMSDINSGIKVEEFTNVLCQFLEQHRAPTRIKEMGRLVIVGHNIPFDIRFINWALRFTQKPDLDYFVQPNLIDTYALGKMAWGIKGNEKLNLTACTERIGVTLTDAHGAMNDVEATADLFRSLTKKLRAGKGSNTETDTRRPKGSEFFEFKCGG